MFCLQFSVNPITPFVLVHGIEKYLVMTKIRKSRLKGHWIDDDGKKAHSFIEDMLNYFNE